MTDPIEDVPKDFKDIDGNPCTLDTLCRREPAWAASQIHQARARVAELEDENTELRERLSPYECFECGDERALCDCAGFDAATGREP